MMEGDRTEEQAEEIESLEYIYEEGTYKVIGENPNRLQVDVADDPEDTKLACRMLFTLPLEYPGVAPEMEIFRISGVSKEQCIEIKAHVEAQIEDLLEMPMIFSLSTAAKEWLQEHGEEEEGVAELEDRRNKAQGFETLTDHPDEETEVVLKRTGTPVTPESFAQWKAAFDVELAEEAKQKASKAPKKLTGREMFETGAIAVASDGAAGAGEADVDYLAARKETKASNEAAAEAELENIDMGVWEAEDLDGLEDLEDLPDSDEE